MAILIIDVTYNVASVDYNLIINGAIIGSISNILFDSGEFIGSIINILNVICIASYRITKFYTRSVAYSTRTGQNARKQQQRKHWNFNSSAAHYHLNPKFTCTMIHKSHSHTLNLYFLHDVNNCFFFSFFFWCKKTTRKITASGCLNKVEFFICEA